MLLVAPLAHAEKADRDKPINLEADHMAIDDLKKIQTYEGKVVMTQGTLVIRADKIVVTQNAEGAHHGVATVAPGNLAYFREKRDGVDEYVEGWGERIEYDDGTDKAEMYVRARLKRNLDEVHGNFISYDGKTEYYLVKSGAESGTPYNPDGRVRATIQPKKKEPVTPSKAEPGSASKPEPASSSKPGGASSSKTEPAAPSSTQPVSPPKTEPEVSDPGLKPTAAIADPRPD